MENRGEKCSKIRKIKDIECSLTSSEKRMKTSRTANDKKQNCRLLTQLKTNTLPTFIKQQAFVLTFIVNISRNIELL